MLHYNKGDGFLFLSDRRRDKKGLFFRCLIFAAALHLAAGLVFVIAHPQVPKFDPILIVQVASLDWEAIAEESSPFPALPDEAAILLDSNYEKEIRKLILPILIKQWEKQKLAISEKSLYIEEYRWYPSLFL